jgi:peptidoglycan/LPS O-acetylase OafA/YrhL
VASNNSKEFEPRLESMRGIAALIVASHHGLTTFPGYSSGLPAGIVFAADIVMERLSNPGMAVLFFFVLSGYVLGRSLERDGNYARFITRRAFRIMPAFVAAVLFGYASLTMFRIDIATPGLSDFFKLNFWPELSPKDLWDNFLFRSTRADGPTWSIYWEIIGSIFLPGLVYLHQKVTAKYQIPLFIIASAFISFVHVRATDAVMLSVVEYFYAGFFLPPLVARHMPNSWLARTLVFLVGYWLILTVGPTNAGARITMLPASLGGSLMIGAVISSDDFLAWLRLPSLRFLGRVSYSFYLFHFPVFYLTALAFVATGIVPHDGIGNWIICASSIAAALGLSVVTYRYLEMTSMRLGRWITLPRTSDQLQSSAEPRSVQ